MKMIIAHPRAITILDISRIFRLFTVPWGEGDVNGSRAVVWRPLN